MAVGGFDLWRSLGLTCGGRWVRPVAVGGIDLWPLLGEEDGEPVVEQGQVLVVAGAHGQNDVQVAPLRAGE